MLKGLREFWLNRSIRAKGAAIIVAPVICLIVLVVWFAGLERQVQKAQDLVVRAEEIRQQTERLRSVLVEAESGIRGYVITGSLTFLGTYAEAAHVVLRSLDDLAALERANSLQMRRLETIRTLALRKLDILQQEQVLLAARNGRGQQWDELGQLILESKACMEELQARINEFLAEEDRLLAERSRELDRRRAVARAVLLMATALGLLGAVFAERLFTSGVARRLRHLERNARRLAGGEQLVAGAPGRDEMACLDRELHAAAAIIAEREARLRESIAEQARVEEELAKANQEKELVLNSAAEGIWGADTEGRAIFVNAAAARMVGWEPQELIGKSLHALTHHTRPDGSPYPSDECTIYKGLKDGRVHHRDDDYFWRKDGSCFPVEYTTAPLHHNGRVVAVVMVWRDITERRRAEEELRRAKHLAEQANRAKSDFLARMSHEIRTPMNAIVGMADLLRETPLNEEQRRYVQTFQEAGASLLALINDILDLSKVEAGRLELESIDFDLEETVAGLTQFLAPRAHRKGLELAVRIVPGVATRLRGDPQRLRQVLINLIGNAIKFTEQGEVVVTVGPHPEHPENPNSLHFAVADTGSGIPADKLDLVFDSFTQAAASTARLHGGTGLGLAISRALVQLMGGRIWVQSAVGCGTTFHFTARFEPASNPGTAMRAAKTRLDDLRVLVVDDNKTNLLILNEMLTSLGAVTGQAESGEQALAELCRASAAGTPYDLLLTDCRMPGMDGFELAERVERWSGLAKLRILMLSSDDRVGNSERCRALGIAGYVVKPVRKGDLLAAIHRSLDVTHGEGQGPRTEPCPSTAGDTLPQGDPVLPPPAVRVLVTEDSPNNLFLIQAYLKPPQFELDVAPNGAVAVEKFQSGEYDVVLMDVQMPVMDGYTATRQIRAWEREQKRQATPVLALTAHALKEEEATSLAAGCTAHLTKPIRKATLLEAIQKYTARDTSRAGTSGTGDKIRVEAPEGIEEAIPLFLDITRGDVQTLWAALREQDFAKIRSTGHDLKGTGAGYGFDEISAIGKRMEDAAKASNGGEIEKQIAQLASYLDRVEVVYR